METKDGTFEIKNPGIDKAYVKCSAKHSRPEPKIKWLIGEFNHNTILFEARLVKTTLDDDNCTFCILLYLGHSPLSVCHQIGFGGGATGIHPNYCLNSCYNTMTCK